MKILYEFGSFRLEPDEGRLLRDGKPASIQSQTLKVLQVLVKEHGHLLTKRELTDKAWRPGYAIGDGSLNYQIRQLRKLLGDDDQNPQFIKTEHKRGFRFIAPVMELPCLDERLTSKTTGGAKSISVIPFKSQGDIKTDLDAGTVMLDLIRACLIADKQFDVVFGKDSNGDHMAEDDPIAIGKMLAVDFVVSGTIIRLGRQIRVIMFLTRTSDGKFAWSDIFSENSNDILGTLDRISQRASRTLSTTAIGKARTGQQKSFTRNADALKFYEEGWSYLNQRTPDALIESLKRFERAVEIDSGFAEAYAGIADCNLLLGIFGSEVVRPREAMPKAKDAALRALEIDETLAEAHASLGTVNFLFDRDWVAAEKEFKAAIRYNPEYATARQFYSHNLALMGRTKEALAQIKKAQQLRESPIIAATVSRVYYLGRQYERAVEAAQYAIKRYRRFFLGYVHLGIAYKQIGRISDAIEQLQMARKFDSTADWGNPATLGELGHALAISRQFKEADKIIEELEEMSRRHYVGPLNFAKIYMGLGEFTRTFEYLEKTYRHRSAWLLTFKIDPVFDAIRDLPQFQSLLKRIGLPE